jgi:hypothetical protein
MPPAERTEPVDRNEEAGAPEEVDDRTDAPPEPERLDRCAPVIPLAGEADSVVTEVALLFEAVRPEVEVGLFPVDAEAL